MEEQWLYEAISGTYLPILQMFEGLVSDPNATVAQRQRAQAMLSVVQSGKAPAVPR